KKILSMEAKIPRAIERYSQRRSADPPFLPLFTGPCDGPNRLHFQVHSAKQMVLAVGDVKDLSIQCQSLWIIELCAAKCALGTACFSCTRNGDFLTIQVRYNDSVMRAVRDE